MSWACTHSQLFYSYYTFYLVFIFYFYYLFAHLLYLPQSMSCTDHMSGVEWIDTYCIQSYSCPEWDSNPQPMSSIQMVQSAELSGHNEFDMHSETTLYICSDVFFCSVFKFHYGHCLCQYQYLQHIEGTVNRKGFSRMNCYNIHHWRPF